MSLAAVVLGASLVLAGPSGSIPGGGGGSTSGGDSFSALMASCNANEIPKKVGGVPACAADSTGTGNLGSGLASTTNDLTASGSVIVFAGATESLTWTYTSNTMTITSTTGVNNIVFAATITANTFAGNATTATALAANPADCAAGSAPEGILASGAVNNCTAYLSQANGDLKAPITDPAFLTTMGIPIGANPTVTTDGDMAIDTTGPQLLADMGSLVVLSGTYSECALITDLAATTDNRDVWMAPYQVTITSVGCSCEGTCTSVATLTLEDHSGNAMTITGTNPTCATSGNATYAAVTGGNVLAAGERLNFDTTAVTPETDEYMLCWTYTIDRL